MQHKQAWLCAWVIYMLAASAVQARPESGDGVVRFLYADADANEVYVVGDWNGWSPTATPLDPMGDGTWLAEVFLDAGIYEYKLLVDGQWIVDPDNPELSDSGNSRVRVGANGIVLPPEVPVVTEDGEAAAAHSDVRWGLRYLGFFTSRKQETTDRFELERPQHLIDVSLQATPTSDLDAWVLLRLNSRGTFVDSSRVELRFDRAQARWHPGTWDLRLVENTKAFNFDDPAVLVGDVGIYQDAYGYQRRGVFVQQRIAGAPLQFLYTDNTELLLPQSPDSLAAAPLFDSPVYSGRNQRRGGDTIAFRFRGGRADAGLGFSVRHDRGLYPGRLAAVQRGVDSLGAVADAQIFDTTENWTAWGIDLSTRVRKVRLRAEYLWGTRHARSSTVTAVTGLRPDSLPSMPEFQPESVSQERFDLSRSRRVVVGVDGGSQQELPWNPQAQYQYEEHHQGELVTGLSFLMRRHTFGFGVAPEGQRWRTAFDFEQHWFTYPTGSAWETQFWFRRHNPWLDEDVNTLQRTTLLGVETASSLRLQVDAVLWEARDITTQVRLHYVAPGLHQSPTHLESVLRFTIPLPGDLSLRTHSRLATYRRFNTQDPEVLATLGPGPHLDAGVLAKQDYADKTHDYTNYAAHFVEVVYEISSRSDIALGFGVDPWVLYRVRNEYMDIGWEQFVFAEGASPQQAYAQPERIGQLLENAEATLQRERRIMLEARLRF